MLFLYAAVRSTIRNTMFFETRHYPLSAEGFILSRYNRQLRVQAFRDLADVPGQICSLQCRNVADGRGTRLRRDWAAASPVARVEHANQLLCTWVASPDAPGLPSGHSTPGNSLSVAFVRQRQVNNGLCIVLKPSTGYTALLPGSRCLVG